MFLFALFCFVVVASNKLGPIYPPQFEITYQETFELYKPEFKKTWDTKLYYDSMQKMSRHDFLDGQHDSFCYGDTPQEIECRQIVRDDGWRYMMFPSISRCCKCCNSTMGCGIMAPNWIEDGNYVGEQKFGGKICEGWEKMAHAENYYYVFNSEPYPIPCAVIMNSTDNCVTLEYDMDTYKFGYVDPKTFELPTYCSGDIDRCKGFCGYF